MVIGIAVKVDLIGRSQNFDFLKFFTLIQRLKDTNHLKLSYHTTFLKKILL